MENNNPVVNGVYYHINNGGVSFLVTNESGPTINIQASHFGHLINHIQLHVDQEGLKKLGEMLVDASKYEQFSPAYVCAAETKLMDKNTGKVVSEGTGKQSAIWTPSN